LLDVQYGAVRFRQSITRWTATPVVLAATPLLSSRALF
jgi:hypothetical protein